MFAVYLCGILFAGALVIGIMQGLHHNFLEESSRSKAKKIFKLYSKNNDIGKTEPMEELANKRWWGSFEKTEDFEARTGMSRKNYLKEQEQNRPRRWLDFVDTDGGYRRGEVFKHIGIIEEGCDYTAQWTDYDLSIYIARLRAEGKWSEEDIQKLIVLLYDHKRIDEKWVAGLSPIRADTPEGRAYYEWHAKTGTPGLAGQAKTKLAEADAKAAKKAVVKGAVVGGIVAGDAGAVVGAMAAKAEVDAKNKSQ